METFLIYSYPIPGCLFGGVSKIFDGYSDELKYSLLTSKNKHTAVAKLNSTLTDSAYNVKRKVGEKVAKRVMKTAMATPFARMQQLDEFPLLHRNSPYKRFHKSDLHNVNKFPLSWQCYIQGNLNKLRETMPRCIEE